jgi:hypothetical protein
VLDLRNHTRGKPRDSSPRKVEHASKTLRGQKQGLAHVEGMQKGRGRGLNPTRQPIQSSLTANSHGGRDQNCTEPTANSTKPTIMKTTLPVQSPLRPAYTSGGREPCRSTDGPRAHNCPDAPPNVISSAVVLRATLHGFRSRPPLRYMLLPSAKLVDHGRLAIWPFN